MFCCGEPHDLKLIQKNRRRCSKICRTACEESLCLCIMCGKLLIAHESLLCCNRRKTEKDGFLVVRVLYYMYWWWLSPLRHKKSGSAGTWGKCGEEQGCQQGIVKMEKMETEVGSLCVQHAAWCEVQHKLCFPTISWTVWQEVSAWKQRFDQKVWIICLTD